MQIVSLGNRYEPNNEHEKLFAAVAAVEGVPVERVTAWPGSSDPLNRSTVVFASPERGIVTAAPTYALIWRTGAWIGAKVTNVPLTPDYNHNRKAHHPVDTNTRLQNISLP